MADSRWHLPYAVCYPPCAIRYLLSAMLATAGPLSARRRAFIAAGLRAQEGAQQGERWGSWPTPAASA